MCAFPIRRIAGLCFILALLAPIVLLGSLGAVEPARANPAATVTSTRTPTKAATKTPTRTPTRSGSATATRTPTRTPTRSGSATATRTPTRTPTRSGSATATRTPTRTPTTSGTATATRTPTGNVTPTATATPVGNCTAKPPAPTLLAPPNKISTPQTVRNIALDWSDSACALTYQVAVYMKDPTRTRTPVVKQTGLTASQHLTLPLTQGKNYGWQAKACNGAGCTASAWWSFAVSTQAATATPTRTPTRAQTLTASPTATTTPSPTPTATPTQTPTATPSPTATVTETSTSTPTPTSTPTIQPVMDHCGVINADETWGQNATVHQVTCNVTVELGATLTIEPGTIIKFRYYSSLYVSGTLLSQGTAGNPVYFTSLNDDSVGGDTNGDDDASAPAKGDWSSVSVNLGGNATFEHTVLRYGGTTSPGPRAIIYGYGSAMATLTASEIRDSGAYGIWMEASAGAPTLNLNNTSIVGSNYAGVYMMAGNLSVANSTISQNGDEGISIYNPASLTVTGTTFTGNGGYAMSVSLNSDFEYNPQIQNNTASGNTYNAIYLSGYVGGSSTLHPGMPYAIGSLTVNSGSTLTIEPGTIIKFPLQSDGLGVSGTLAVCRRSRGCGK